MIGATTSLEVSALGRFEVRRDHDPLSGGYWSRRKVCDLFKLLLSADQHRLHREQVQEILWPTSSSEQAANSFGKTLYLLRRALEPELAAGKGSASTYVLLDHDALLLLPNSMGIDADIFESSAKQLQIKLRSHALKDLDEPERVLLSDEFERVLALYGGDYLPEDLYEDWTLRRRDRLRRVYSWLLENAAELAVLRARGPRAREYLQALLERNSADEQTHRKLMLIYARMGRRSEALNQYQLLRQVLHEELQAQPLPETEELLRAIQAGQVPVDLEESWRSSGPLPGTVADARARAMAVEDERYGTGQNTQSAEGRESSEPGRSLKEWRQTVREPDPERILKAALVGREEEIARMQRAYNQAHGGQRRVVFICGEPGIGKTRLAREFTRWGEETQQATVLWGYSYAMSGSLPYQPIADAIGAYIRQCTPEQLRGLPGDSMMDLAKIAPEVRFKLPALAQPESLGPEIERRNLYSAVARYINTLAEARPLIIILDDLQWADAASIELLSFLTLQSAGVSPFDGGSEQRAEPLYIMLYRADEVHESHPLRGLIAALARGGAGEDLRLQRLTQEQVQQLLENMAQHSVDATFAGEIYRHTEGNPFFIGEAVRSLILEGKIKRMGERWQATVGLNELEIPQSVRLLIERRLLHLSPDCRATLAMASVLGRQFSSALLCQARDLGEEIIAEHIDEAIRGQIISSLAGPRGVRRSASLDGQAVDLAFTHDNIREVLYQQLNPLRRRALHRQAGQAIEKRYASRLQPHYGMLAYHYQMSEDAERAVDYLLKAANHAGSVYAFSDVAGYLESALELLVGDEERSRRAGLLSQLPDIYIYTGRLDKAIEAGMAACTLWRDLGDAAKEAEAYLNVSFCYHWMGCESEAVEHIKRALACLETEPGEQRSRARAYAQWGLAATNVGDVEQASAKLRLAEELHAQLGGNDPFISVVSLWASSWCAFLAESPRQMLEYAERGAEVCRAAQRLGWEPMMNYSAAWAYMLLGQLDAGEQMAREAREKAQRLNVVGAVGWANLVLAFLAIQGARWEEAGEIGNLAYQIAEQLHDVDLQSRVHWSRSVCAGWLGDWERAIDEITKALQMIEQEGEPSMVLPYLLVQSAKAHFYAGRLEEAQASLDQGLQIARSHCYRQLPALAYRIQGRIWQSRGKFEQARDCFERSLSELLALGDEVEYARTQEAYGQFYCERNQGNDAERGHELLESARATFRRLGVNG